jgi:hypothetical protein
MGMRIALAVIAILFATSAAYPAKKETQKGKLTLSCDGTSEANYFGKTNLPTSNEPIKNMGLVIDYDAHRVDSVVFSVTFGNDDVGGASIWFESTELGLSGTIDRISGAVEVTSKSIDAKTKEVTAITNYHLQCKPAKRMF